jgi:hypothetical protein
VNLVALLVAIPVLGAANVHPLVRAAQANAYVPAPRNLRVVDGTAPGLPADAISGAQSVPSEGVVYLTKAADSFGRAHEVGHVFDAQDLSDGDRTYFQKLMHAPGGQWNQGTGLKGGLHSPHEWFADYYGAAATGVTGDDLRRGQGISSYATLGPKRLDRFIAALERLGRRQGLDPYSS